MATDNNHDNNRIDILEAALQALAASHEALARSQEALAGAQRVYEETQQQQTAAIQRHDMDMEIGRAIQRDQAASIQRHDMRMEMLQATQDRVIDLIQTVTTMLYRVMDTQQEHSNDIRDLRENRDDNAP